LGMERCEREHAVQWKRSVKSAWYIARQMFRLATNVDAYALNYGLLVAFQMLRLSAMSMLTL